MKSFRLPTSYNFLVFLICFFFYSSADACLGRFNTPNPSKPELYDSIFIAKIESFKVTPGLLATLDITPPYTAALSEPIKTLYGKEQSSRFVNISAGCGIPRPQVGKVAVFFVSSESPEEIEPLLYDAPDGNRLTRVLKEIEKAVNTLEKSKSGHK